MTQDYYKSETTKRYDIPLTHLDYSYIRDCTDVKELEKILRILRSGDEGHYPELENEAEKRLEKLCPKSRMLRKDNPALRPSDLDRSEQENLKSDLETWKSDMEQKEQGMGATVVTKGFVGEEEDSLPPVRSAKVISVDGKVKETAADDATKNKKAMPRSYKEWDKFDIDKELEKVEEDETDKKPTPVPSSFKPDGISPEIDTKGMSEEEKTAKATREKDKGNEAFRAHDWEESILYYSRSISIAPLTATYNNRALAYLRLSEWGEAINDCNYVLNLEPENIKALLRRASAHKGKKDFAKARPDLELVLQLESHNKTAQDLVKEINDLQNKAKKGTKENKEKGRRMMIEEVDGSDKEEEEEDDDEECDEIIVEKADHESKPTAVVNGFSENAKPAESSESAPVVTELGASDHAAEGPQAEASSAAEGTSQETLNTNTESAAHKDIWSEGEVSSVQNSESNSSSQKPKLVTTNILSENSSTQNTKAEESSAQKKISSEGSGDVDQLTVNSTEEIPSPVTDIGDTQKGPKEVEEEEEEEDSAAAGDEEEEAEPEHVQPVLVQKALSPVEAALREKGNNFFRTGQYSEAIEIYQKIINKLEKVPEQVVNLSLMYSNRSACYLKIGDCQAAIRDCSASLELVPHSVKPLLRKAAAFETLERYHHAYVDYKHVLSVDSSVDQAHQGASRCQNYLTNLHGQQWRNKLPPLKRFSQWEVPVIVDENDTSPLPPKTVSSSPSAAAAASSSKAASTETRSSREIPSVVKDTRPQRQDAEKKAPQPKVPSPEEQFETTKAQGNTHVQKGEYEAAVRCYSQCVKLFSNRAAVFTNRALCYLKLNEAQKAEQDCSTALSLESNNCKAFYRRALARKAQKHYKDSLQDLLLLLRLDSSNSAAKKEMEIVKGLYKEEYDQLKSQPPAGDKKKATQPEKKRKRMKIEEVDEDSETEEKPQPPSVSKPKASGAPQKSPSSTPSHSSGNGTKPATPSPAAQPPPAPDNKHANARTAESRKPGRGKSKKGSVKETSLGLPVTPTSTPKIQGKITPFEFIQHWNSLKQAKDIQPYVQLLEQISPDDLPGVISNKLDGHMLSIITRCAAHDAQTGEVERAYSILSNIRQVPRFSTVKMFLSNKEKQDIRKVLESSSILGSHSVEEVTTVRKDYGLK